jgi:formate--tetrahydrofolate ligase
LLREIQQIAKELDIEPNHLKPYGKWIGKISLDSVHTIINKPKGKLILVTAITPTSAGEGKTVTAIGLSMGLNRIGQKAVVCLRQPSLGPVFGVKGGAAGGGKSTVEPMQEVNLHLTGDIYAVGSAHNLLSAMIDNHIFHGNALCISLQSISWRRTVDMNERSLRHVKVGLGGKNDGIPRDDGFVITAASEVMAVLCIARDYSDLKKRLDQIIIGTTDQHKRITALDLKSSGAMSALLKDAMQPNLLQTVEGTPALIHGGPFGNIALGTCSLTSIIFALNHADFAVVEAGFATELGAEKFFDVVSRVGGFGVDCAIIVASIRALEHHGTSTNSTELTSVNDRVQSLLLGLQNLAKHIENVRLFGIEPLVALNHFAIDTDEEVQIVKDFCDHQGVSCTISRAFEEGGEGCVELAHKAVEACKLVHPARYVYDLDDRISEKIDNIVTRVYGGMKTEYSLEAMNQIETIEEWGMANLPICMAKTQLSLSDDPKKLGRPSGFTSFVKNLELAAGAGHIIVDLGNIIAMPGLPAHPAAENIDLAQDGTITGIF